MENLLHDAWVLFVGIGSWLANKLSGKLETLDKDKANADQINEAVRQLGNKIHDVEKKVDTLGLTAIGRSEYKVDLDKTVEKINGIHLRVNALSERLCSKEDRIQTIRVDGSEGLNSKKGK